MGEWQTEQSDLCIYALFAASYLGLRWYTDGMTQSQAGIHILKVHIILVAYI